MKSRRYIDIHIEQPGDPKQGFDVAEYIESFLRNQGSCFIGFEDKTMLVTSSTWNEVPALRVFLRVLRVVLTRYATTCLRTIERFLWKVAPSKWST